MTTPSQSPQMPAFVRTAVPLVVGYLLTKYALPFDGTTANLIAQAVVSYVYYALVHIIELKFPAWGFLLGIAKAPAYSTEPAPSPGPDETVVADVVPDEEPLAVKKPVKKVAKKSVSPDKPYRP